MYKEARMLFLRLPTSFSKTVRHKVVICDHKQIELGTRRGSYAIVLLLYHLRLANLST